MAIVCTCKEKYEAIWKFLLQSINLTVEDSGLILEGQNLLIGLYQSDYSVTIEKAAQVVRCRVTGLTDKKLTLSFKVQNSSELFNSTTSHVNMTAWVIYFCTICQKRNLNTK